MMRCRSWINRARSFLFNLSMNLHLVRSTWNSNRLCWYAPLQPHRKIQVKSQRDPGFIQGAVKLDQTNIENRMGLMNSVIIIILWSCASTLFRTSVFLRWFRLLFSCWSRSSAPFIIFWVHSARDHRLSCGVMTWLAWPMGSRLKFSTVQGSTGLPIIVTQTMKTAQALLRYPGKF